MKASPEPSSVRLPCGLEDPVCPAGCKELPEPSPGLGDLCRTALVTGAGSGIGRAAAQLFAERGWRVVACDQDAAGLGALAAQSPGSLLTLACDGSTQEGALLMLAAATRGSEGRLDALVLCADAFERGAHGQIGARRIDHLLEVKVHGLLHGVEAGLPALRATRGSHLVAVCSTWADGGLPDLAAYSAANCFVRAFMEALHVELAPEGVHACAVLADYLDETPPLQRHERARRIEQVATHLPAAQVALRVWDAVHGDEPLWRVGARQGAAGLALGLLENRLRRLRMRRSGYVPC